MRVLLTGASSGIGRELALALARAGAETIVVARREDRLQELAASAPELIHPLPGDLIDPVFRGETIPREIGRRWGSLDCLVNGAGVGAVERFDQSSEVTLRALMEINFFAPVELTRSLLPFLRRGTDPGIVNVSSVLGHRAVPGKSEYCATKFALHGWSDAIRAELSDEGIDVLLISPSTTNSEFWDSLVVGEGDAGRTAKAMSAEVVARATLSALRRRRHESILSPGGKALVWLDRLLPAVADRLVARFGDKP
ncbi:MAG TPA: SDR family NAD(P)-dependent oxidoreductase [Pirellulaceae bacterium]|jgi:short-subunit dehydrogenase|nr:SDR family NAD(P)-dependent oxidoreductase [Pirellulaceae bacterium]